MNAQDVRHYMIAIPKLRLRLPPFSNLSISPRVMRYEAMSFHRCRFLFDDLFFLAAGLLATPRSASVFLSSEPT